MGNKRLENLLKSGKAPIKVGVWLDAYNQAVSDIAGIVSARINDSNHFVTIMTDEKDNTHKRL